MHDTRGSDDLVRRVAFDVEASRCPGYLEIKGPNMQLAQSPNDLGIFEIKLEG